MSDAVMSLQAIKAKLQKLQMQQQQLETTSTEPHKPATSSLTFTNPLSSQKSLDFTGSTSGSSSLLGTSKRARFNSGEASQSGTSLPSQGYGSAKLQLGQSHRQSAIDYGSDSVSAPRVTSSVQPCARETQGSSILSGIYSLSREHTMETSYSHAVEKPSAQLWHKLSSGHDRQARDLPKIVGSTHMDADITAGSTREFTDTQNTATSTFEVGDHKARMKWIEAKGNAPEEWKAYIDFLKTISSSGDIRRRPLSEAYSRAFYGILKSEEHKNSEVFVKLTMDYVQFKSERFEWDSVDTILDMARSYATGFSVLIVAWAEVKIVKGDHEKALSVVKRGLDKGRAQPRELLLRTIKAIEAGQSKLLSDAERRLEAPGILGQQNCQDSGDFKVPGNFGLSHGHTDPLIECVVKDVASHDPVASQSVNHLEPHVHTQPSSTSKPGMRHYSSTPEVRSSQRMPSSSLQNSKMKGKLGLPMRVRNPLQQHAVNMFSAEKEEDTDFIHSVKPLHPSIGPCSSISTSGYQSDLTVPMEDSSHSQIQASSHKDVFSPAISTVTKKAPLHMKRHPSDEKEKEFVPAVKGTRADPPMMRSNDASNQPQVADGNLKRNNYDPVPHPADTGGGGGEEKLPMPVSVKKRDSRPETGATPAGPAVDPAPPVSSSSNWQGAVPVMSTPSCKGQLMHPAVAPTPNGELIETVVVNGEPYHVLKKVGRGGSAQVYMVLDSKKNIRALKVVDLEGAGPEVIDGFRNEISLLQRLQYCDSVIKMYNFEYNEKLNRLYVILEFGETDLSGFFTTRAKQQRGLDPTMIKFYWGEMLRAVNALHREGIIHSDLKPANFMLVAGNLKLIDFGIANALQQDKTSVLKDSRVGTPSYMSPEAIMAACDDGMDDSTEEKENMGSKVRPKYKVGVRSDVWSLGCILYNMVYGRTPFQHIRNNMCKLQAITNPNCEIKFPPIPDARLMDVLQKCLTRDVKLRPTTQELLDHPYLTTSDKDSANSDPSHTEKGMISSATNSGDTTHKTPENKPEAKRLKELLQSHMAQGSPGTQALITNLMQKLDTGQRVDPKAVLHGTSNGTR